MAKMAVLVPHQDMVDMVEQMFDDYPRIQRLCVEHIKSEQVVRRAKELEAEGCDVIMARGLQAKLIKHNVRLPLVEIRVTAQELGSLVLELKEELQADCPKIGIFGFDNMLCDTSQFDRLFHIQHRTYTVKTDKDSEVLLRQAVADAVKDGIQGVIGGDVVCRQAEALGLRWRFIHSGWESIQAAFQTAGHVCYAIDLEKVNHAEMNTMLDNIQSGILRLDSEGVVTMANAHAFNLLNLAPKELIGANLTQVFPSLNEDILSSALLRGEEAYTILVPPSRRETVVNIMPVFLDDKINGAILTLQEGHKVLEMNSELRYELYLHGYMARWRFEDFPARSEEGRRILHQAERIAMFSAPVLLSGEAGSGKEILAQCIHNGGVTKGNAFISMDCRAYQPDTMDTMLFGTFSSKKEAAPTLVETAQDGTLFLDNVEELSPELQFKLFRLVQGIFLHNGSTRPQKVNVRVVASTQTNLITKVENGSFRADLYYSLNALGIHMKPLRERREDILDWAEIYLARWRERYDRPVYLTQGAKDYLKAYDWPGNLNQVNSVCEQIVLLSERKNVDEGFLRRQIERLTPKMLPGTHELVVYRDERAVEIAELLKQHHGNRQKVADALGVSKTTLWRYIKKYGIDKDYSY